MDQYIQSKKNIQSKILEYIDNNENLEELFNNLVQFFKDEKIHENYSELKLLFNMLMSIANYHYRSSNFFDKIIKIILIFKDELKNLFTSTEIFQIFQSNKRILLFLLEENLLELNKSFSEDLAADDSYFYYFYLELASSNTIIPRDPSNPVDDEIINYINSSTEEFKNKRKVGENDAYISKLIREDDIDNFITYINKNSISVQSKINYSIYETNLFLIKRDKQTKIRNYLSDGNRKNSTPFWLLKKSKKSNSLIKYAAFFGSVQIFKYLYLNGAKTKPSLVKYALHGSNSEIIDILEQKRCFISPTTTPTPNNTGRFKLRIRNQPQKAKNDVETFYIKSIQFFQKEETDYIQNNYLKEVDMTTLNSKSIEYYNFYAFPDESQLQSTQCFTDLCKYGYLKLIELIASTNSINFKDLFNDDLLETVIQSCHFDIFKFMLENKPENKLAENKSDKSKLSKRSTCSKKTDEVTYDNISKYDNIFCLSIIYENVKVAEFLLSKNIEVNSFFEINKNSINVSMNADLNEKKQFHSSIRNGPIVKQKTALQIASEIGNTELLSLLLKHQSIDVNNKAIIKKFRTSDDDYRGIYHYNTMRNRYLKPPFIIAVENNDLKTVKLLLESQHQIDVNNNNLKHDLYYSYNYNDRHDDESADGYYEATEIKNALFLAVELGNIEMVDFLTKNTDIDINFASTVVANLEDVDKFMDLIMEEGYDFNSYQNEVKLENQKKTALLLAIEKGNSDIISLLLSVPNIDTNTDGLLNKVIKMGDIDAYNSITSKTQKSNNRAIAKGELHHAIEGNNIEMVKIILNTPGIDVNDVFEGNTPLQVAAQIGNAEICELLLECENIDVNKCKNGSSPLFIATKTAAQLGNTTIFNLLFNHPNFDIKCSHCGQYAMNEAAQIGNIEIFKALLERPEIDVNFKSSNEGNTVLHYAVQGQNIEIIKMLLERKKTNVNVKNKDNLTAFQMAVDLENVEIIKAFLNRPDVRFNVDSLYPSVGKNKMEIIVLCLCYRKKIENPENEDLWNKLKEGI